MIIGHHLDNHRHFVRRVAFVNHELQHELVVAGAGTLPDGPLDHIARDTLFLRLLNGGEQARVAGWIAPAELGRDGDFLDDLADGLTFFQVNDRAFCVEPLTSHKKANWRSGVAAAMRKSVQPSLFSRARRAGGTGSGANVPS